MSQQDTQSPDRIPIVKLIGGAPAVAYTRRYEIVAYASIDERDHDHLSQFVWTLAKDHKTDYANRNLWIGKKTVKIQMHRELWEWHRGPLKTGESPDHIDRNGLNNRLSNLRLATATQQQANQPIYANNKTGFKGVCLVTATKRYQAQISVDYESVFLGQYDRPEEAALAYNHAGKLINGDYSWQNPIDPASIAAERQTEIIRWVEAKLSKFLTKG